MVKKASESSPPKSHSYLSADSLRLPFRDGSFDFIIASGLIEYISDMQNALVELNRVLRPNGRIIITVPTPRFFYTNFMKILSLLLKRPVGETPYPHYLISPRCLKKVCLYLGWSILEERRYHFIFFPLDHILPFFSLLLGKNLEPILEHNRIFSWFGKGYVLKCIKISSKNPTNKAMK